MSNKIRAEVDQYATGPLPVRIVCPECGGGSTKEECLVVWQSDDDSVFATCHRSRCKINTVLVRGSMNMWAMSNTPKADRGTTLTRPVQKGRNGGPLTDEGADWIKRKCTFQFKPALFKSDTYFRSYNIGLPRECVMFPMLDVDGSERGTILKPIHSDSGMPKSLTYKDDGYNGMSWYLPIGAMAKPEVYLVEDVFSALALRDMGLCAVSLNGTLLNEVRLSYIRQYKSPIHICLDADASRKAVHYAIKYGSTFNMKVSRLEKDFKDMTNMELASYLIERGTIS